MMNYLIELIGAQLLLFLIYRFAFRSSRELVLNRVLLLVIAIFPLMLPLIPELGTTQFLGTYQLPEFTFDQAGRAEAVQSQWSLATWIWCAGLMVMLVPRSIQLIRISRWYRQASFTRVDGIRVGTVSGMPMPFSIGNMILIPTQLNEQQKEWVIRHEIQHVKQKHYLDLWLADALLVVFWFNPLNWFIRREIKLNHEYLSDAACVSVEEREQYAFALLANAMRTDISHFSHSFSLSGQLKNRINMIHQPKNALRRVSYFIWLPVLSLLFVATACERENNTRTHEEEVTITADGDEKLPDLPEDKKTPSFPGGMDKMMEYMGNELKYPEAMKAEGKEAKVMVQFKVDQDGHVSDVKALNPRGTDPSFIEEATRVVREMPEWEPGDNEAGDQVKIELVIPINFKL